MSFINPNVKLRGTAGSGTAYGLPNMYVLVTSIDTDKMVAHVKTQVRGDMIINLVHGVGQVPKAGETWLVTSIFGPWTFLAKINPTYVPLIEQGDPAGGVLSGTYPNPTAAAPTWTPLTLASGIGPHTIGYTPAYYKEPGSGRVFLRGTVAPSPAGQFTSTVTLLATLPAAITPAQIVETVPATQWTSSITVNARLEINSNNQLNFFTAASTVSWLSLDNVSYWVS